MAIKQFLGNLADRAGTLSANIGGPVGSFLSKERGISEKIAGSRPTVNTGITPQSKTYGFTPYSPANKSNMSTGLSVDLKRQQIAKQLEEANKRGFIGPMDNPNKQKTQNQTQNQPAGSNITFGGGASEGAGGGASEGAGGGVSEAEAQRQKENAEQERKNEEFRQKIGGRFNELRGQFGGILGEFQTKLGEMPNAIRQLGQQYKTAIGEQETQRLGQIGQQREKVAEQQKSGLRAIAEDVRAQTKAGISRLSQMGAGNSSAAKMFQFAIQKAANSNTANLLKQAADNYNNLDQEETKLKSEYNTMRNNLDLDEQNNIKRIDDNINNIIKNINDNLAQSGELERLSKEELNAVYVDELTNAYRNAVQQSKTMKDQLEQWRLENTKSINSLKNQLVQDFIPKDITTEKLTGVAPSQEQEADTSQGLNLRKLKRLQEEGTPQNIANPNTLQARVRRLREQL